MKDEKPTFQTRFRTEILDKLSVRRMITYCLEFFLVLILVQFLISPKDFSPFSFLQIICSFIFGWFVTLANLCIAMIPTPESYPVKMVYIIISLFLSV